MLIFFPDVAGAGAADLAAAGDAPFFASAGEADCSTVTEGDFAVAAADVAAGVGAGDSCTAGEAFSSGDVAGDGVSCANAEVIVPNANRAKSDVSNFM
jgi:hypothetical protein